VNGKAERREDCARLFTRDGTGARRLPQGRSIEPRQHDAEAAVQGDFTEHLRRRAAGGEDRAGHLCLVLDDPPRDTWLGQLDNLTGRPGVDISEHAFADLFPQRSLHARSPPCRANTGDEQKGTLPSRGRRTR
jgi:hypothetical protein